MNKFIISILIISLLISCSKNNENSENIVNENVVKEIREFEGDFIYFADAAVFIDHTTKSNYNVAMEEKYIDLEREYLSFNFEDPTKVYLVVEGYLENRKNEDNITNTYLIVTKVIGFDTNNTTSLF